MTMAIPLAIGAFGALIGSFLNVVIHRVPLGRSLVAPPSACVACGSRVRPVDNIPVLSWLVLRGRCRDCGERISARYPLVELGTAAFFALVAVRFLPADGRPGELVGQLLVLAAFLAFAAVSVSLAAIDLDVHRLPNAIVLPMYPVAAVLLGAAAVLSGDWGRIAGAVLGAVLLGAGYLVIAWVSRGMGMGDVKLAGLIGLHLGWLGWDALAVGTLAAFLLGGLFGVALLAAGRGRRTAVPFGPWMLAGAWLGVFAGPPIAAWYLDAVGVG